MSRAPLERKFSEAAFLLGVAARLNAKYGRHDRTAREIAELFHKTTADLVDREAREALVAHAARRATGPDAPAPVVAAIERQLWRQLLTFAGWPECLRHVEPEGRS